MTQDEHRGLREMLGAYALGHLAPAEEARIRLHLENCPSCRDEHAAILPVVRQLALLAPAEVAGSDPVPSGLGERVVSAVGAERRSWRRAGSSRTALVGVAAALVAAVVSVGVMRELQPEPVPLEAVTVAVDESGVTADADLVNHTWGVEIKLAARGLDSGETYRVSILTTSGEERPAGEFVGTGPQEMLCNLNSSVLRPDAAGFVVEDETGATVISSTFAG